MSTFERVKNVVAEQLDVNDKEITLHSTLQEDLGADSIDLIELVMSIEEEFGIQIPDEDARSVKTVKDVVDYIDGKLKGDGS